MENTQTEFTESKRPLQSPLQQGRHQDDKSQLAVTVAVAPETAFHFFRDFKNLSLFMTDLKSVKVISPTKSRWVVEVKGKVVEWDAVITAERAGEMIAWASLEESEVETCGTIWFTPAPQARGTIISLVMNYKVPGGKLTEFVAKMSKEDPNSLVFTNLRKLKCYLETGELATIEGQPSGRDEEAETILKH